MTGLIGALELVKDKATGERFPNEGTTGTRARDISVGQNGLVMRAVRDTLLISPPLIITEAECDTLVARAARNAGRPRRRSSGMSRRTRRPKGATGSLAPLVGEG